MTTTLEYWPNAEAPDCAIRWSVEWYTATAEVCSAAVGYEPGSDKATPFVCSDGGCEDDAPLDGPWKPELTVEIKSDGFARMWCDDMHIGTVDNAAKLAELMAYLYRKAAALLAIGAAEEAEARARNALDAAQRIADSHERVARRKRQQ